MISSVSFMKGGWKISALHISAACRYCVLCPGPPPVVFARLRPKQSPLFVVLVPHPATLHIPARRGETRSLTGFGAGFWTLVEWVGRPDVVLATIPSSNPRDNRRPIISPPPSPVPLSRTFWSDAGTRNVRFGYFPSETRVGLRVRFPACSFPLCKRRGTRG